eukprot:768587-Hanusia_phi.AAC.1
MIFLRSEISQQVSIRRINLHRRWERCARAVVEERFENARRGDDRPEAAYDGSRLQALNVSPDSVSASASASASASSFFASSSPSLLFFLSRVFVVCPLAVLFINLRTEELVEMSQSPSELEIIPDSDEEGKE